MAEIYKIGSSTVTIPVTGVGKPISVIVTPIEETDTLGKGIITVLDVPIVGAAVVLIETTGGSPETYIEKAIVYTNSKGEFGIPFTPVSGKTYSMDIYYPNTIA